MPRGSAKGEHRGGRKKGAPNKATWQRSEQIADEHKRNQKPHAVEVLETGMMKYLGLATKHQDGEVKEKKDKEGKVIERTTSIAKFERYFDKAMVYAEKLAPYQTPKLQSTALDIEPLDLTRLTDAELEVLAEIEAKASVGRGDTSGTSQTQH